MHDAGAACVYVETARRPPHTVRVSAGRDAEYEDNGVSSWTLISAASTVRLPSGWLGGNPRGRSEKERQESGPLNCDNRSWPTGRDMLDESSLI
jgi:hypothetical protein